MRPAGFGAAAVLLLLQPWGHAPAVPTSGMVQVAFRDPDPLVAWPMAQRLLEHRLRAFGTRARETGEALQLVAKACRKRGNDQDPGCVAWAHHALLVWERAVGPDHASLVSPLQTLATIKLTATGEPREVERIIRRILAIYERHNGYPSREVATALWYLGSHYVSEYGDPRGGLPYLEDALAMREAVDGPRSLEGAKIRFTLAVALAALGDYNAAFPTVGQVLDEVEAIEGPQTWRVAYYLEKLAGMLAEAGAYQAARNVLDRSEQIRRRLFGDVSREVAACLVQRGILLAEMGDDSKARADFEAALPIIEVAVDPLVRGGPAQPIPRGPLMARALLGLAEIDARHGDATRAVDRQTKALRALERAAGWNEPELAHAHALGAALLRQQGRLHEARVGFEQVLRLLEQRLGRDHPLVAETLNELARLDLSLADTRRAGERLDQSWAICVSALGERHRLSAETLALRAAERRAVGDAAGALEAALRSEELRRDQVSQASRYLSERAALHYSAGRASALDEALDLAAEGLLSQGQVLRLWDALARSRGLVLREMAARRRHAATAADPRVAELQEQLSSARRRLAHLVLRPVEKTSASHAALVREAVALKERLESRLGETRVGALAEESQSRGGVSEALGAAGSDAALVAFAEYRPSQPADREPRWLALVMGPDGSGPRVVPLGGAARLTRLVQDWRLAVAGGGEKPWSAAERDEYDYRQAGAALRRELWDPLLPALAGARRVFVVPEGALHQASLATLSNDDGSYLLERGPLVHYIGAEGDLLRSRGPGGPPETLVALGGPDFDSGGAALSAGAAPAGPAPFRSLPPKCDAWRRQRFEPLPHASAEVAELARRWRERGAVALELTGRTATEESFKRLAPTAGVLHVASHAFFVEQACRGERGGEDSDILADAPLVLSGLALAGANERHRQTADAPAEDGMLTAEEVASLDLSRARWVVLSACETGAGDLERGEGVLGMRRAFAAAGAGSLIMSLWRVEDEAARTFMQALYSGRLAGLSTAEAVRAASLDSLREARRAGKSTHPRNWGAFVAVGDWR